MSKMTREERLAAGWVECWGLYDWSDGKWLLTGVRWGYPPEKRYGSSFADAMARLTQSSWNTDTRITARRFWRRKKPKAKPPLKVGDEVMVRGVLVIDKAFGGEWAQVRGQSGHSFNCKREDIVR
jgi:hypothetical protein